MITTAPTTANDNSGQASSNRKKLIKELLSEIAPLDRTFAVDMWQAVRVVDELGQLTNDVASKIIKGLIANKRELVARAAAPAPQAPRQTLQTPDARALWDARIPQGISDKHGGNFFFAGVQLDTDDQARYYRVNRRANGHYLVKMFKSDELLPVNATRAVAILDAIAADAHTAGMRYAADLTKCMDCNRRLTDETSRKRGRGPDCDSRH